VDKDFIGHIGGDDFTAILYEAKTSTIYAKKIIGAFDQSILAFYNQDDLDKGYITTTNRHGISEDYPLLSISIVAVSGSRYKTTQKLSEDIAMLKRICKQNTRSSYIIS
jgi:GGDEF domain-containing protein